ncbi:hypothetical protein [Marimonas arenosa]|uniref:Sulfotransferase domain-containing protein n=1 Tax=Marimonas arenosa TaxID=1795305 RepID=A0AAE3WIH7_9RHOB|nr:hypothetical protein [Marimonas arenosa]MDQ2092275.1 sulfotransferase domain-containing protein [Marimonas arenosa]
MRKEIFIHVGAGKTGTTALQAFFFANESRFTQKGVHFPQIGRVVSNAQLTHHGLSWHGVHRTETPADTHAMWRDIAATDSPRIVITSEYLHSSIAASNGPAFFKEIARILAPHDVRIVFYLRRQSQWLQSAYAQWVKVNLLSKPFPDFVRDFNKNPVDQVFLFAGIFGAENMIVRPYERGQFDGGNIQRDFCAAIGIDWDDAFVLPEGNPNPRLTGDALELKRQMNSLAESPDELRAIQRDLQAYSDHVNQDSRSTFVAHAMLDPAEAQRIETENAPKYARIARDLLGRVDGVLFRDPLPKALSGSAASQAPVSTDQVQLYMLMQMHQRLERLRRRIGKLNN